MKTLVKVFLRYRSILAYMADGFLILSFFLSLRNQGLVEDNRQSQTKDKSEPF